MIIRFVAIISLLAASCTTPSTNAEDFYRRAILSLSKKNPSSESISLLTQTLEINPSIQKPASSGRLSTERSETRPLR